MIWLRNGIVYLLSLLLFTAILGGVVVSSINYSLAKPAKLETWLKQSGIYDGFINTVITQAKDTTGEAHASSGGVSLSDVAVQQAANAAFSPTQLQQYTNTFLESNYAWLQGRTATPDFVIDLTSAKQNFARQVGQYVAAHLSSLPVCSSAQAATAQNTDPLMMTCRPPNVDPQVAGAQVTQKLATNDSILSNTIITAKTINPNATADSQPYYQRLSAAPKIYQNATRAAWVLAGTAALSTLGVIFISNRKRRGLRRVATVFLLAGLVLVGTKFAADIAMRQIEKHVFNAANVGDIQQSLTRFAGLLETNITNFDMYCGIGLLVLALVIIVILLATRPRGRPASQTVPARTADPSPTVPSGNTSKPTTDTAGAAPDRPGRQTPTAPTLPSKTPKPAKPKRPRLIQ